jgi:hypothetical protein
VIGGGALTLGAGVAGLGIGGTISLVGSGVKAFGGDPSSFGARAINRAISRRLPLGTTANRGAEYQANKEAQDAIESAKLRRCS